MEQRFGTFLAMWGVLLLGAGGVCSIGKRTDGSDIPCGTTDAAQVFRDTRETPTMSGRIKPAFDTIKVRCPTRNP